MKYLFLVFISVFGFLSGCVSTRDYQAPNAYIVMGARVEPKMREGVIGLLTPATSAGIGLAHIPKRRDIRQHAIHVRGGQGWSYQVFPVVSGLYIVDSVYVRGGGARGTEITHLSRTQKTKDGGTSVRAAYLFDVPKGSVAYIGSFDVEASGLPVDIDVKKDVVAAKASAKKAGLDVNDFVVLDPNRVRGMNELSPKLGGAD